MNFLELTALTGAKTVISLDRIDFISTGYDQPGCKIHFSGGGDQSVSDDLETIQKLIKAGWK